jgi:hypothetical protein
VVDPHGPAGSQYERGRVIASHLMARANQEGLSGRAPTSHRDGGAVVVVAKHLDEIGVDELP